MSTPRWFLLFLAFLAAVLIGAGLMYMLMPEEQVVIERGPVEQVSSAPVATGAAKTPQQIFKDEGPGVVYIAQGQGGGSGFVVSKAGDILTNAHVVQSAKEVKVSFDGKTEYTARVVASDRGLDVALLRVEKVPNGLLKPLALGSLAGQEVGDPVAVIGSPFGLNRTLTTGIISALDRNIPGLDGFQIGKVIQTDAAINPGNSGGPLIDGRGRVIGINSQIISPSEASAGVGFAVPIDSVRKILPGLRQGKTPSRPWLGVSAGDLTAPQLEKQFKTSSGTVIREIVPSSPAAKSGWKQGQLLTKIGNKDIKSSEEMVAAVQLYKPGQTIEAVLINPGGKEVKSKVKLAPRPKTLPGATVPR